MARSRNLKYSGWISFLTDFSSNMIFPLLPLHLTRVLGATPLLVGLIEGAAETVAAALKLYSGRWSDRIARRKPMVVLGYALSSLSKLLFLPAVSWLLVLGARVIERIGKGIRSAPRDALIADEVPAEHRGAAFGWQRAMDGAGGCLGALAALALIGTLSYRDIFALALIPAVLAVLLTFGLRESAPSVRSAAPTPAAPLPVEVRRMVMACGVFAFGHLSFAFLILAGGDSGLSDQRLLLGYALYQLIYTLLSPIAGRWSDKVGRRFVLLTGYALFAASMTGLAFASGGALFVVFMLYGIAEACIDATQRAWITDRVAREQRATALGAYHGAIALAALPGGIALGLAWTTLGVPATAILTLIGTAIAALSLVAATRVSRH